MMAFQVCVFQESCIKEYMACFPSTSCTISSQVGYNIPCDFICFLAPTWPVQMQPLACPIAVPNLFKCTPVRIKCSRRCSPPTVGVPQANLLVNQGVKGVATAQVKLRKNWQLHTCQLSVKTTTLRRSYVCLSTLASKSGCSGLLIH